MSPILQSGIEAVATVAGVPLGGFQTISGGEVSAESVKDRPTGSTYEDAVAAPPTVSNIVISRSYDEGRDGPLLSHLRANVGIGDSSVGRVRRDNLQNQIGITNYRALLVRLAEPEGDKNSSDKGMLELEFNVSGGPSS